MKKIVSVMLLLITSLILTACTKEDPIVCKNGYILEEDTCVLESDYIDIYYINDFHGALLPTTEQIGISYIANLINTRKIENPDQVLFLAGGDILQGSALSNYYNGLSTINLLNLSSLDAFTIGNHEFDWGIDVVTQYADGNIDNGEADFPFLGANIYLDGTTTIPDGIEPYTIIEKGEHKIGIIGTIGYGLEYSIATSKIEGYYFGSPTDAVEEYATLLRTEHQCDTVIVIAHDTGTLNNTVTQLTGDARVDAIFNGHSHSDYTTTINGIPVMQSGASGEFVGQLRLNYENGQITSTQTRNLTSADDDLLLYEDTTVQALLQEYIDETDPLFNTPIITSEARFSSYDLTDWIAQLIRIKTGSDIAFHNYGGTRTDVASGEVLSLGKLYEIWPFDNVIKTVELTGTEVNWLISSGGLGYNTTITTFNPSSTYLVATNDYVFDKDSNPFLDGENINNTGLLLRDLAEAELLLQSETYDLFNTSNTILSTSE
ncbi:bifunctional metallophosphatase/5'-nucleotidase [Candidatus Xianfuyuplasma coldseepsis]|uniref:Bifunctional metallophosphatase/5'-nucleotidase n=1 Tax=Candidatus Xianfuyuplasma coldseepsis TaxID=2782163 RepID=A0A7L7KPV9_9MOLU|nr:bifunctional UDP-sugar hydrolase/5'-nucleotidase [Xianfuyuplasma coldseepsis]QMS84216.1 bifunctional metallophosphatase/5'-nucleotidase [Xianfuyuplasma coldseepsis]